MNYKKRWPVLPVFIFTCLMLSLAACASKSVTYVGKMNGADVVITLKYDGDKVKEQKAVTTVKYASLGVKNRKEAKERLASLVKNYQGVKGLEEAITYEKDQLVEMVSVDYTKADMSKIVKIPGFIMNSSDKNPKSISLKKTVKMLEEKGFKKK